MRTLMVIIVKAGDPCDCDVVRCRHWRSQYFSYTIQVPEPFQSLEEE